MNQKISQAVGMDLSTGKLLSGIAHLKQSIYDILKTAIGSRVMRRDYGAKTQSLVDAVGNKVTIVGVYYAIAVALERWEPRFDLTRVHVSDQTSTGKINFILEGTYLGISERIEISRIDRP